MGDTTPTESTRADATLTDTGRAGEFLDSQGMFAAAHALPEQVLDAVGSAEGLLGLPSRGAVTSVVVLGMGGSGVAGDILQAIAAPFLEVPVTVVKGYVAPAFVGPSTLVFAVSFSGNTEETLEAATTAVEAGASMVAVTQGGRLAELARDHNAPVVGVPTTIPQPRAGIGAVAIPPLVVLEDMGLLPGARSWIGDAVDQLRHRRESFGSANCPARSIAAQIGRTIPLIYGGGPLGAAAAARWKNQVNENAKSPAFWNTYPELCHNEVAGWGQNGDVTRRLVTLVELRHDFEHPQVSRRAAVVDEVLDEVVADIVEVHAEGKGPLAQLLDLVMLGDFVSLELAAQEGLDPGPVPVLDRIKATVAR